jgi:hypothetical protein
MSKLSFEQLFKPLGDERIEQYGTNAVIVASAKTFVKQNGVRARNDLHSTVNVLF